MKREGQSLDKSHGKHKYQTFSVGKEKRNN